MSKALEEKGEVAKNIEIAFFGGSFTAIDREYMLSLLKAANKFTDHFGGIRISTRPDYIDPEILEILANHNVTSIELGAQSTDETVLALNNRGHSKKHIFVASDLIKSFGFSLGLQMMTGLYGSDFDKDRQTALDFVSLRPDTVRIYPTVIMKDTELASLYNSGLFVPYTLEESVSLCTELITLFERENIKIIRLGLHYSDSLAQNSLGNNYHPAFKELCESKLMLEKFLALAKFPEKREIRVFINPKSLSKLLGQKKCNLHKLEGLGYKLKIEFDDELDKYGMYIL